LAIPFDQPSHESRATADACLAAGFWRFWLAAGYSLLAVGSWLLAGMSPALHCWLLAAGYDSRIQGFGIQGFGIQGLAIQDQ
jgi:hypothetical protein